MPRPPQYTDEELLTELRELAERLGRYPPRKRDMNEYGAHSGRTYQLRFGSWSEAVAEAGFEPREKGADYQSRPEICPLCGVERTGLDFHHWRYGENKTGCYLCRECHDQIHAGDAGTDNPDWLLAAIQNLANLHVENREGVTDVEIGELIDRYNLPQNEGLVDAALR